MFEYITLFNVKKFQPCIKYHHSYYKMGIMKVTLLSKDKIVKGYSTT